MAWINLWLAASTQSRSYRELWNLFILKSRERNGTFPEVIVQFILCLWFMSCPSPETLLPSALAERAPCLGHFSVWVNTAWLGRAAPPEVSNKWKKEENQNQNVALIWILQGSQTQRAVTPVGQWQKVPEFYLGAKAIKSELGEGKGVSLVSRMKQLQDPAPWGTELHPSPAWAASRDAALPKASPAGRHWAALLGLERLSESRKLRNHEEKLKWNTIYSLKELRQLFRFVFISADARSFLILMCVHSPIPTDAGTVRTHLRLPDRFLVWFCKVSWESGDISCFAAL